MSLRRASALLVALVAALPYLPALDNCVVQDDFGVVGLLSGKPARLSTPACDTPACRRR